MKIRRSEPSAQINAAPSRALDIGARIGDQCAHVNSDPSRVGNAPEKKPTSTSILLADDLKELQELIAMWLEEAGHRVTRVSTGREVIEQVGRNNFDLLVTDILMPQGDGWSAIAEVQRLRPQMRILAISGGAREMPANAVLRSARAAGAIASLEKPFSRPDFLDAVARVLAAKGR